MNFVQIPTGPGGQPSWRSVWDSLRQQPYERQAAFGSSLWWFYQVGNCPRAKELSVNTSSWKKNTQKKQNQKPYEWEMRTPRHLAMQWKWILRITFLLTIFKCPAQTLPASHRTISKKYLFSGGPNFSIKGLQRCHLCSEHCDQPSWAELSLQSKITSCSQLQGGSIGRREISVATGVLATPLDNALGNLKSKTLCSCPERL